ncbi:BACON domain-containing protein [Colwellia hornerae]|uniref:BACON domain-containing protein n=1 Tax=Colwellia hornerae TaxID=89402 RepID=A0A5C6QAU6_9GAMM|nr:BACON domain-containing protein [Colwellia hornerae]TWX59574.1 BACON domain-containing protein [Colwellia hornerae]TWX62944.1 BACON domain-containing protein [Colwellia hornerae]TWX65772.1 BACON domain-containing protein [Colwellia hornerae]
MKVCFKNLSQIFTIFCMTLLLSACGGSNDKSKNYAITADVSTISFSNEIITEFKDSITVKVTFAGDGLLVGYAPDSQPVGWLAFRTENLTANSATIHIDLTQADQINIGEYVTKLRFSTGELSDNGATLVHHDINVSLLIWQANIDTELVSFRGTFGDVSIPSQTIAITSESNDWQLSSDIDWITFDISSGSGDATVTITPKITGFTAAQLSSGNIILTETTTGDTKLIPVEVGLDNQYLYTNQASLAFTSTTNISALEQTIKVNTNTSAVINWQASSAATWLTLTKLDNDFLKVVVDINAMPAAAISQTEITINAIENEVVIGQTVPVSLFQSSEQTQTNVIADITANSDTVIAAPNLPYFYLGSANNLLVYQQYSGELVATIAVAPENTELEQFIVHPDGSKLLAKALETIINEDETTTEVVHRYNINLNDYSFTEIAAPTIEFEPSRYVKFSGRYFIVTQTLEYANEDLQRLFWDRENVFFTSSIDQAAETEALYALDSPTATLKRYSATINDFSQDKITTTLTHEYKPELLAEGDSISSFVVSNDETALYLISPTSEHISFDGSVFTDQGLLTQADGATTLFVEKSNNNLAHYLRFVPASGFVVNVYNQASALTATIETQGQQPSSIDLSADDKRLLVNATNSTQIEIVTLAQFDVSATQLSFNTTFGNTSVASQEVDISGVSDSWQATADVPWLAFTQTTTDESKTLVISIDANEISGWGLFTGIVTITDPETGINVQIVIELAVDEIRLFSDASALTFTSQADKSTLSHTVDILTNKTSTVTWQAQSNVDWLSLTVDTVNNTLAITADPSKIATNGLYYGEVTLSPVNSTESVNGTIRVSFEKGDFDTSSVSEIVIPDITPNSSAVVLDPLRPNIYIGQGDVIKVFNIITGAAITTINSPLAGVDLTNLVIHPDGSLLLASNSENYSDENGQPQTRINHYQINLSDFSINLLPATDIDLQFRPKTIAMIAGKAIVISQALEYANLALAVQFWDRENIFNSPIIYDVPASNNVLAYNANTSALMQYTLAYNAFTPESVQQITSNENINNAYSGVLSNIVTSSDGADIYTASTTSEWTTFDGTSFADQGVLRASIRTVNVAIDSANNSYFYRFDSSGFFLLSKYDKNQQALFTVGYTAGSIDSYLSPSYQRIIHYNASSSSLVLDYIPD